MYKCQHIVALMPNDLLYILDFPQHQSPNFRRKDSKKGTSFIPIFFKLPHTRTARRILFQTPQTRTIPALAAT